MSVPAQDRRLHLPLVQIGKKLYPRYDPERALEVIERIADGELLKAICSPKAEKPTVSKQTFLYWVSTVPELSKAYSAAQMLSAHSFEELAIEKAQVTAQAPGSSQNVAAASLLISQYRWSAARRNPTKYSDKGNTQIVVPVSINTTLDMGSGTGTTEAEVPDIYSISIPRPQEQITEAEYNEITSDIREETQEPGQSDGQSLGDKESQRASLRALLATDRPVIGKSHQPSLQIQRQPGKTAGPRKRVLIPGSQSKPYARRGHSISLVKKAKT